MLKKLRRPGYEARQIYLLSHGSSAGRIMTSRYKLNNVKMS